MSELDSTERFTDRVDDYLKYRPDYPVALYHVLEEKHGLKPEHVIADLGAGTGLLARLFLEHGHRVIGVEPNEAMLRAGERSLEGFASYLAVRATAEDTSLEDASVDVVTAGQAFHWFDPERTRTECRRILTPAGFVVLVWNTWHLATTPLAEGYASIVARYTRDKFENHHSGQKQLANVSRFFAGGFAAYTLPHGQRFDREGLRGRMLSSSYAPSAGDPKYAPMVAELDQLFDAHCDAGGVVDFELRTQIFVGRA